MAAAHLRRVTGLAGGDAAEVFGSYGRYWGESLALGGMSRSQVVAGVRCEGLEHLDAALAAGRGAVAALPHLGNWDLGGACVATLGYPLSVVVEALRPPEVFEWFAGMRRELGFEVIPAGAGAAALALQALRSNRVLCLLCDRVVGETAAIDVEFFGETTRLPAGPVTIALRSSAPLIPIAAYFTRSPPGHLVSVGAPLELRRSGRLRDDVAQGTGTLARALEGMIARAPAQWHLLQPNWPSDEAPGGSRNRRR